MRAILLQDYGSVDNMQLHILDRPDPPAGCVLIKVHASSVNPIDTKLRSMIPPLPIASKPPYIPGIDVAGEVAAIGTGVTEFEVGDYVYGCPGGFADRPGTLAEYVVADVRSIAHTPKNISMAEAAALPVVAITAWEAIFERITLTRDDSILIYGGTGGVGHIAVQLAATTGANVIATASSNEKAALTKALGAHDVFNARNMAVPDVKATYGAPDFVLDTIGGSHLTEAFDVVRIGGEVVTIAARTQVDLTPMHAKGLSLHVVAMLLPLVQTDMLNRYNRILTDITHRVEAETLRPLLAPKTFTLETIGEAHTYLDSGQAIGKVVVLI